MREIAALFRAAWLTALSYRMNLLFSLAGLGAMLVPLYFVAGALQPVAAESIATEGGQYLGFLIIGIATLGLLSTALLGLPKAIIGGIGSGVLETMLATPARLPALLFGFIAQEFSWGVVRTAVTLLIGAGMGMSMHLAGLPYATLAIALTLLAYFGMSLALSAMILVFRTMGPLGNGIATASSLLGGVYYSVKVIPSWIQQLSSVVPLTYGLRAARRALLSGAPFAELRPDLLAVAGLAVLALALGGALFAAALRHARREGSLGQY
ncbi:MAG: ABC transporter permease [Gemmatimonadales bacterium]